MKNKLLLVVVLVISLIINILLGSIIYLSKSQASADVVSTLNPIDTTPPIISMLYSDPREAEPSNNVKIEAQFIDVESGVKSANICYQLPSGGVAFNGQCIDFVNTEPNFDIGARWEAILQIPAKAEIGHWTPSKITAINNANVSMIWEKGVVYNSWFTIDMGGFLVKYPSTAVVNDLQIKELIANPNPVSKGTNTTFSVTVVNMGNQKEIGIRIIARNLNGKIIKTVSVPDLEPLTQKTITVPQLVPLTAKTGDYIIKAEASVANETDATPQDNTKTLTVTVK